MPASERVRRISHRAAPGRRLASPSTICVFVMLVMYLIAHTEGIVDTLGQGMPVSTAKKKQRLRTIKERRDIVEETLVPGALVAHTPNTMMSAAKVC